MFKNEVNEKSLFKKGIILLLMGIIIVCIYFYIGSNNPKLVVKKYIKYLEKGDLENIERMGFSKTIDEKINQLGTSFYNYIQHVSEIYYKNGFEIWAKNLEKIWKHGISLFSIIESYSDRHLIVRSGFNKLTDQEKDLAENYELYILSKKEIFYKNISYKNFLKGFVDVCVRNNWKFKDIVNKLSRDKREYILSKSKENTSNEYLTLLKTFKIESIDKEEFIYKQGRRLLKQKLIEKYSNFNISSLVRVDYLNEFKKKPFRGDISYILLKSNEQNRELVFKVERDKFSWNLVSIPGNVL